LVFDTHVAHLFLYFIQFVLGVLKFPASHINFVLIAIVAITAPLNFRFDFDLSRFDVFNLRRYTA
jgi:hypothetical protein